MEIKIPGFSDRVGLKDLAIFSRQFATMINSGLSLIRALSILTEQTENKKLAEVIDEVRTEVEAGRACRVAGRAPEGLPQAVRRDGPRRRGRRDARPGPDAGRAMYEADVKLRSKIKSAMTYPVIVLIMAIVLSAVMLIFIVPVFEGMFADLGGELPLADPHARRAVGVHDVMAGERSPARRPDRGPGSATSRSGRRRRAASPWT
jgi:type IV pilus assembly protein PilC